jgi:hypothetical protein
MGFARRDATDPTTRIQRKYQEGGLSIKPKSRNARAQHSRYEIITRKRDATHVPV